MQHLRQPFEWIAFKVLIFLSGYFRKKSDLKWREFARNLSYQGGATLQAPSASVDFKANNKESLKSLTSKGFQGDAVQRGNSGESVVALEGSRTLGPRIAPEKQEVLIDWKKELVPFLMNQLSEHTRRAYENDLKQFFVFLKRFVDLEDISLLQSEHVILYRKALEEGRISDKPMQKATINRKLAVVKSFMNWLKANKVLAENPAQFVKGYPQSQESSLQGFSDEEVVSILSRPNRNSKSGALHFGILTVLFYLGLRKGELIDLKIGDLGEERGISVLKVRGKGHKIRILPLTKTVQAALSHYLYITGRTKAATDEPLFTPTKNPTQRDLKKKLNPNAISYIVKRYAVKSGVLKKVSPHSCRATCISNALDKKATQRSVQHLAGWSTPLMIQRYDKRREDLTNSAAYYVEFGVDLS